MENKFEILIRFIYLEKEYYIVSKENKIYFVCNDNNEIKFKLSNEEKRVSLTVYSAFLVSKENAIQVDRIDINNRDYNIFYDKESGNYFWKRVNNVDDDNAEDNIYLNIMYNHQNPIMYMSDKHKINLKNKIFTKLVIFGTAILVAVGAATIDLETLSSNYEIADLYNDVESTTQDLDDINEYDWNRIKKIIDQNSNLQDDEKEFLYNLKIVFDEHHDKMDLKLIEKRLATLRINYKNTPNEEKASIKGSYDSEKNAITMYGFPGTNFSEENMHCFNTANKDVLMHEELEVTCKPNKHYTKLHELSNEYLKLSLMEILEDIGLIERDEEDNYIHLGNGYESQMPVYYILTKFMTIDEIIDFQYTGDRDIIANALAKYGTIEDAYKLLTKIDTIMFEKDDEDDQPKIEAHPTYIYRVLNEYYKKMTGHYLHENIEMRAIMLSHNIKIPMKNDMYKEAQRRNKALYEVLREELIKAGKGDMNFLINPFMSYIKYNNNLFFGIYRANMQIIFKYGGEDVTIEITEQMQKRFDEIYQSIDEDEEEIKEER